MTSDRPTEPEFHITGRGFVDGKVTVDGKPFPWTIYSISWRLDPETEETP